MTKRIPHLLASAAPGGGLASNSGPVRAATGGRAQAAVRQGLGLRVAPQLLVTAALLSVGAAVIHAAVAGPHFDEYTPFGLLFLASALGQTVWAVLLLAAPSARLLAAGAAGNLGILAAWALSRTTGLPVGPEPGTPEPIGALDIAASAFELGLVVAALLLIAARCPLATPGRQVKHFAAIAAAVLVAVAGAAFAKAQAGAGHHGAATEHHADPAPNPAHAATARCGCDRTSTESRAGEGGEGDAEGEAGQAIDSPRRSLRRWSHPRDTTRQVSGITPDRVLGPRTDYGRVKTAARARRRASSALRRAGLARPAP